MQFDLISIFPSFFNVLELSLMGKAVDTNQLRIRVHDLREWTHDRHRSVDDAPYGGGAGMVMKPNVWGRAIDAVLDESDARRVLAIPTPSGVPLTQQHVRDLAGVGQIIVACGRYEGIDARVSQHYRNCTNVEVFEYSIGDFVLNGGEVAALALVEAVARLREGFMGNPESLKEESFEDNLLEYPAYTRPEKWRDHAVPEVLKSGDHGRVAQWRRRKSLMKTARRRPDLLNQIPQEDLNVHDLEVLAACGWMRSAGSRFERVAFAPAQLDDAPQLAQLAAQTFPDACPPEVTAQARQRHIREYLSEDAVRGWIQDPQRRVMVARWRGELVAYTMIEIVSTQAPPPDVPAELWADASLYLSKCYARQDMRGTGIMGALLETAVEQAPVDAGRPRILLGTHVRNRRAQKFYKRHGWRKIGKRVFLVGGVENQDVVYARTLA
ncbi:tRNA (guanosine(37)-N1)-methyltransferase TrmD [Gleimia hominis]|uniref:tRNA (guanosine(37)-N1)-methyltransferase TrmD n=1 Tax=Gleimia hominis TaxID=595468 RepID=UPI000C806659|nr:tRNA (guanosine(37)-N1)-methyltransferase TrmD [Gleimia hominis]WIK65316.1 tRNA (guanosine(37)-N1)-methyltransferase TrmD [Gleimia hominis]